MKAPGIYFAFAILVFAPRMALAQQEAKIPYSQKVERDDRFFRHMLNGGKGVVTLTEDSLIFKTKKARNKVFNFAMSYCQIRSIGNWNYFIWPNRIHIRRKSGGSFRLFTYKRKTIIRLARERMAKCRRE